MSNEFTGFGGGGRSPHSITRQRYPDPFLDVASTKLPKSLRKLFQLCYIFGMTHPQISPIIKKLAKYPITHVIVNIDEGQEESLRKKWKEILEEKMDIYSIAEGFGLDFFGYGNCFLITHKPFIRIYECEKCGYAHTRSDEIEYYIEGEQFHGKCESCGEKTKLNPKDEPNENEDELSIVRLDPSQMYIRRNDLTGKCDYYYKVPSDLKKGVSANKPDRDLIDSTPLPYVKAAIQGKKIKFRSDKVLHSYEAQMSGKNMGWGMPITLPSLKDAYLNQVYKKADETVANERAVPARFIYPEPTAKDPIKTISLSRFSGFLAKSIRRWRYDKNQIMPVPFPVGVAEVGGNAQRLNTKPMREMTVKEIIGSLGVPEGFLSDGMTWSGGSVQLRMLENMIMSYMRSLNNMLQFVVNQTAKIIDLPPCDVKFKPFKMADDIQKLQILNQLAQAKQVSYKEILDRLDLDWDDQHDQVKKESSKTADLRAEEQMKQTKAQLEQMLMEADQKTKTEGYKNIKQEINQHAEHAVQHMRGEQDYYEIQDKADLQEKKEQQRKQQLKKRKQEAEVEKTESEAMENMQGARKKQEHAEYYDDQQQKRERDRITQTVQDHADSIEEMSGKQQKQAIQELAQNAPRVAKLVVQELKARAKKNQESHASTPNDKGEGEERDEEVSLNRLPPDEIVAKLRDDTSSVKAFANKITLLEPEKRKETLQFLVQNDPGLAKKIFDQMNKSSGGGQRQQGSQTDMRPQPQAKPPRRDN